MTSSNARLPQNRRYQPASMTPGYQLDRIVYISMMAIEIVSAVRASFPNRTTRQTMHPS